MKNFISIMLVCIMLISAALPTFAYDTGITMHLNGNKIEDTGRGIEVDNGIFSATTSGAGIFALAFYKNSELVSVQFSEDKDLSSAKLNMVVDSDSLAYDQIKIFRFDEEGKPVNTYNKIINPTKKDDDLRIYFNETFDNNESRYSVNDSSVKIVDSKVMVSGNKDVHFPTISVRYPERYTIIEADIELASSAWPNFQLISGYVNGSASFVRIRSEGLFAGDGADYNEGTRAPNIRKTSGRYKDGKTRDGIEELFPEVIENNSFKISVRIDLDEKVYEVFLNRKPIAFVNELKSELISKLPIGSKINTTYDGFSVQLLHAKADKDNIIYADNIRAYSGYDFLDIGNAIPNVHNTDIQPDSIDNQYYERPSAAEIAKKTIEAGHPRVIINADKVEKIKNSNDEKIKAWRELVVASANAALEKPAMTWEQYNPSDGSLDDIPVALETVMNLGLAYQISSDASQKQKYADKAYDWAKVLMNFKAWHSDKKTWVENDWNSDSYLDVGEISTIISICYDWMYDAWTKEQKKEFVESIMRSSIDISYKAYFNQTIKNGGNTKISWWHSTNNWNAVCNGGVLVAALAFMEEDIYRCSRLAEGTIRGFEYLLPKFAPDGAWAEGTGYWAYTLKYLTIACSTLENCCQTLYGIQNTPGLMRSQTYSLDLEGTTGTFGFGDVGGGEHTKASFMYYWAGVYDDPDIGAAADYAMDKFGFTPDIFDLIYYDSDCVSGDYERTLSTYRKGTEVVTFASGHEETDTAIAIVGGKGDATSHDHLDSGSIIVDMNGVRIIGDTGAEHYDAIGYFDTNRFWYYKARPEGHNIFVINPDKIYNSDGETYYHGQSEQAVSEVGDNNYDAVNQKATMNLTDAYSRDASNAKRTISLDDKTVVVEDDITLRSDGNLVEWYYHFKDIISYVYDGKTYYKSNEFKFGSGRPYCEVEIDDENNCVYITYQEYDVLNKDNLEEKGQPKKFRIRFITETQFSIEVVDAQRRHDNNKSEFDKLRKKGELSYDYYTYYRGPEYKDDNGKELTDKFEANGYEFIMDKIVVKMDGVSGTVKLKTIIEAVE